MGNVKFPQFKTRNAFTKNDYKKLSTEMAKSAEKVCLMLSVAILADVFDFEDEEIEKFMDAFTTLGESLGVGMDDIDTIQKNIEERFDVNIG